LSHDKELGKEYIKTFLSRGRIIVLAENPVSWINQKQCMCSSRSTLFVIGNKIQGRGDLRREGIRDTVGSKNFTEGDVFRKIQPVFFIEMPVGGKQYLGSSIRVKFGARFQVPQEKGPKHKKEPADFRIFEKPGFEDGYMESFVAKLEERLGGRDEREDVFEKSPFLVREDSTNLAEGVFH